MANINVTVRYRPIRIGWCIRDGNWNDLRTALRLSHTLWGGTLNPLLPVGSSVSPQLVCDFKVDVLWGIDGAAKDFVGGFKEISWPLHSQSLFSDSFGDIIPNVLDVSHTVKRIAHDLRAPESLPHLEEPNDGYRTNRYGIVHWNSADPLSDILLATFGAYPAPDKVGHDYEGFMRRNLNPTDWRLRQEDPIPAGPLHQITVSGISALHLRWDCIPWNKTIGFYAGKADTFDDVVNYWNLRACGLNVLFLDPTYSERLHLLKKSQTKFIQQKQETTGDAEAVPTIWSCSSECFKQLDFDETSIDYYPVCGIDIFRGGLRSPMQYLSEKTVLAAIADQYDRPTLAFQLPEKSFATEDEEGCRSEHLVVRVRTPSEEPDGVNTFWTPCVPELNQWYGRQMRLDGRTARVDQDGIGIICSLNQESLQLSAIRRTELARRLFELAGIKAEPSPSGRIASRLIAQLGGLRGCRVLKIAGVRQLIKRHSPLQQFTHREALQTIGNLHFSDHENIFIEPRNASTKLTPLDAFRYLLDKEVFRAGLSLVCPKCELDFWVGLDDISAHIMCELCGNRFNITRQLTNQIWTYRRSGLFGRENNQEGSIPVALTLQQLDNTLDRSVGRALFLTNMTLRPATANIQDCETDIVVVTQEGGRIQLAIGECKDAGGTIDADDVTKMAAVADAFPADRFDTYIVFSKTSSFSSMEIEICRGGEQRGRPHRTIMLSDRELEPYSPYEWAFKQFDFRGTARSLAEMAGITNELFFSPQKAKK